MKIYKEDDDFKLVPMNMKCNPDYAFMPMKKKNPYKKMNYNMHGNMMMNKYNYYSNQNCCCMHNHNMMMQPQVCPSTHYNHGMFTPGNMDDMMVKTLITVKKKSELFD